MLILENLDEIFANTPGATVLPINQLVTATSIKSFIDELFLTKTQLGFVSSCACGKLTGNYVGTKCPHCHTEVKTNFSNTLQYQVWLEIPEFAPPILQGQVYAILNAQLGSIRCGKNRVKLIDALMDNEAELPNKLSSHIVPGMWSFYLNFDSIMEHIFSVITRFRGKRGIVKANELRELLKVYRSCLFTRHLPVLDPALHLMKRYGKGHTVDPVAPLLIKTVSQLSVLVHYFNQQRGGRNDTRIDAQTFEVAKQWWAYNDNIRSLILYRKYCCIRHGLMGSRSHFTARAVISPIVGEHDIDEVHLPWTCAVLLYEFEILNLLINRYGYTLNDAMITYTVAETNFVQVVYDILNTLIKECSCTNLGWRPKHGLPILLNRNPSIRHGAVQYFLVTKIKPNPADYTTEVPPESIVAPNGDFDGDQMNIMSIKEMDMVPELMAFHPMTCMLGGSYPGITSDVYVTPPVAISLQAYAALPSEGEICNNSSIR